MHLQFVKFFFIVMCWQDGWGGVFIYPSLMDL